MRRMGLAFLVLALVGGMTMQAWGQRRGVGKDRQGFSDEAVDKAVKDAVKYLWSQYDAANHLWPEDGLQPQGGNADDHTWGGYTALAMYSLLAAGEKTEDPRMQAAYNWVSKIDMRGTYSLGLLCQVHSYMLHDRIQKAAARVNLLKDADRLVKSMYHPTNWTVGTAAWEDDWGMWGYRSNGKEPGQHPDRSNMQYGVLGIWASLMVNNEIRPIIWELIFTHYKKKQEADGGWSYENNNNNATGSMTAASLASTFLAFYHLHAEDFIKVGNKDVSANYPTLKKGLDWMEKNFAPGNGGSGWVQYYYYAVERVGLISGYKYFGNKDWYKLLANELITSQDVNGSWNSQNGNVVGTSYGLLTLVRGRNPVLINHLDYKTGDWNNRPMALYYLTRWLGGVEEKEYNWQVINLTVEPEDWHDAPILLLTGSQDFKLEDADLDKIRRFAYQGGTILSIAEGGPGPNAKFDKAMREYYKKLFPDYELKLLPQTHPLYTCAGKITKVVQIYALSNGVRNLAYHTTEDLPLQWQTNAYSSGKDQFQLAVNILFYANGERWNFPPRGASHWPVAKFTPTAFAKVQRIKFNGNWDPEPLGWARFSILMGNSVKTSVDVLPAVTADKLDLAASKVATLTGTGELTLTDAEKDGLKAFVKGGGTLIVDAAGGSKEFGDTAAKVLGDIFGGAPERLANNAPVYSLGGKPLENVQYRKAAREKYGANTLKDPRLMGIKDGERTAVFFSREDITSGLVGCPIAECIGYEPNTAFNLMRNLVTYGLNMKVEESTSEPTTEATSQPAAPLLGK